MMLKGKISLLPERGDTLKMKRMVETAETITRTRQHQYEAAAAQAKADAGGAS